MARQKAYNVKVFSLTGNFQRVLSETKIQNEIYFTAWLGGWQGEVTIQLAVDVASTIVAYNNIIRVYESDDQNDGVLIYSGVVTNISRISDRGRDYIEVRAIGIASLLTWIYFRFWGNYTFTRNQEIANTIKEAIDFFSTLYPWLVSYTGTSIENTWVTANLSFDYTKCLDAIKRASGWSTYELYIWSDGVAQYHPKYGGIGEITHFVTVGRDVEEIRIEEDSEDIVNRYILTWQSGTVTAENATSQLDYGIRELRETNTSIVDVWSANSFASTYILDNKDLKRRIRVVINSEYNIETIRPWDLLTVRNFEYAITSLKIQKIEYNCDRITLELEQITSFAEEIAKI